MNQIWHQITDIFSNFGESPYIGLLLIMVLSLYLLIFVLQILKHKNVLPITITISILLGIYLFIVTTTLGVADQSHINSLESMRWWLTIAWNLFMFLLLISLPLYVFSMVSTTFTNTRHHEGGKRLLLTSFLSLLGMTLIGILTAILFVPILYFGRELFKLAPTSGEETSFSLLANILHYYSYTVLITIFLAISFAIALNILHKKKHETAENIISFIEKVKEAVRQYLNLVTKLVPYVISGVLILLFNNYGGQFVSTASALLFFALIFFAGLGIVFTLELNLVKILRRDKDKISKTEFRKKTNQYMINVFAVQSAPVVYPMTVQYATVLGVSEPVKETVPTLTTFMGYSMCGGFYPALVVLFTILQPNASLMGHTGFWWVFITISFMIPLILIMTLGMTGVPGADVAIVLGILSILGLNPAYFFTIYLIEPLLDKFRGMGNSMGFAAAAVITDRLYEKELNSLHKKQNKTKEYNLSEE